MTAGVSISVTLCSETVIRIMNERRSIDTTGTDFDVTSIHYTANL